ncbi:MAG: tetratricopeptide repeat protein [Chloroflexota bacterium]
MSPLQQLIWQTVGQLPDDRDSHFQSILLFSYFDLTQPKQSQIIKKLALGRSTYYRYLDRAVEALGTAIVHSLRPSLQLERPHQLPLVGRREETAHLQTKLATGEVIQISGGSGIGKTTLGASAANRWPGPVFWYTFRPKITDQLEQLLFAVALFFHKQNQSDLWVYLSTLGETYQPNRALMIMRNQLSLMKANPPLFCFDQIEHLLPGELNDSKATIELREFLEEWSHMDRSGSPMMLLGQKLLLPPDPTLLINLAAFNHAEVEAMLTHYGVEIKPEDVDQLQRFMRGNPLLLRLFIALHQHGMPISQALAELTTPMTLSWFWQKLQQKLSKTEESILFELSVFPAGGPQDAWRKYEKQIESLTQIGLIEQLAANKIGIQPAFRQFIYQQLPASLKVNYHQGAGALLAERSLFTEAAYHYLEADQPEMGIWVWHMHRELEINQGQSALALSLFTPLLKSRLSHKEDQRVLALLIAQLSAPAGDALLGLEALNSAAWDGPKVSSALAHEVRGILLTDLDQPEQALIEFRQSLELVENLRKTHEIDLHTQMARRYFSVLRNRDQAAKEVQLARFHLNLLEGQMADAAGDYASARIHYANALAVADQVENPSSLARLHESLGVMESRYAHIEAAIDHYKKASGYHIQSGNLVCGIGNMHTNIAYSYLSKRRYKDVIEPAQTALEFFGSISSEFGMGYNEVHLAEANFYLGEIEKAKHLTQSGLRREVVSLRPYFLYIMGHIARIEERFDAALSLCGEAIEASIENGDPWAEAPARNALGETLRDAGKLAAAKTSFEEALSIWERMKIEHEITYTRGLLGTLLS